MQMMQSWVSARKRFRDVSAKELPAQLQEMWKLVFQKSLNEIPAAEKSSDATKDAKYQELLLKLDKSLSVQLETPVG